MKIDRDFSRINKINNEPNNNPGMKKRRIV